MMSDLVVCIFVLKVYVKNSPSGCDCSPCFVFGDFFDFLINLIDIDYDLWSTFIIKT